MGFFDRFRSRPAASGPAASRSFKIESAILFVPGLESQDFTLVHGRLFLLPEGLIFVHGWDEVSEGTSSAGAGAGGAVWAMVEGIGKAVRDGSAGTREAISVGREMLASVQGLPPAEQAERIAGSIVIPAADIAIARRRFRDGAIEIITRARGDRFEFMVPNEASRAIQHWRASLSRGP